MRYVQKYQLFGKAKQIYMRFQSRGLRDVSYYGTY